MKFQLCITSGSKVSRGVQNCPPPPGIGLRQTGSSGQNTAKSNDKGNVDQIASEQTASYKQNTTPYNSDKVNCTPSVQNNTVPTDSGTVCHPPETDLQPTQLNKKTHQDPLPECILPPTQGGANFCTDKCFS